MDINKHESYRVEEFIDLLKDTGMLNLKKGEKLNEFGVGMVNIICTDAALPEADADGYSKQTKKFKLEFQVDLTPTIVFNYETNPSGTVTEINSIHYSDGEGNNDPENNEYLSEFISDLGEVE
jgi:hypothetical protein